MIRVIAMILLSLLPRILSAKVATAHLRDYQGNNRLTYTAAGVVLERNDYYPYGGLFGEEQSLQPFKYSGKELETTNGLNLYDFHARYHDYTLPIFTTQDPQQEKYYDLSPYIYCAGNPLSYIDPDGSDIYNINADGVIYVTQTEDRFNQYYYSYQTENGLATIFIGQFNTNEYGLIQLSDFSFDNGVFSFSFDIKDGNENRSYICGESLASFLGAMIETGYNDVTVIGVSNYDGSSPPPSISHKGGKNMDLRYLRTDYTGKQVLLEDKYFDVKRQNKFIDSLYKYGWKDPLSEKFTPYAKTTEMKLNRTRHYSKSRHNNHLHLQGFRPTIKIK